MSVKRGENEKFQDGRVVKRRKWKMEESTLSLDSNDDDCSADVCLKPAGTALIIFERSFELARLLLTAGEQLYFEFL